MDEIIRFRCGTIHRELVDAAAERCGTDAAAVLRSLIEEYSHKLKPNQAAKRSPHGKRGEGRRKNLEK